MHVNASALVMKIQAEYFCFGVPVHLCTPRESMVTRADRSTRAESMGTDRSSVRTGRSMKAWRRSMREISALCRGTIWRLLEFEGGILEDQVVQAKVGGSKGK